MKKLIRFIALVLIVAIAGFSLPGLTQSTPTRTCAYDPSSNRPNPLGMRAFVTAIEQGGNTTFRFEQFPSPVSGDRPGVTISSQRELLFVNLGVDEARRLMRENPSYFAELVGSSANGGYAEVDAVLVCRSGSAQLPSPTPSPSPLPLPSPSPSPTPTPGAGRPTVRVSDLPNGVYRYWNVQPARPGARVTDEELLRRGGVLFLFRKTGNQVEGDFSYIDDISICVRGTVNGNTVSGQAFPYDRSIAETGETFTNWGSEDFLRVRRGVRAGAQTRYNSAILNLNGFYRINAGDRAPRPCPR